MTDRAVAVAAAPRPDAADPATATAPVRRAAARAVARRATLAGWLLLVPAPRLGFYIGFVIWPLIQGVQYSFYDWNGIGVARWVGVENYLTVFTDPDLLGAIRNAFVLIAFFTFIPVGLGLVLSTLIRGIRYKAFAATAQTVLFLPQIIPLAAAGHRVVVDVRADRRGQPDPRLGRPRLDHPPVARRLRHGSGRRPDRVVGAHGPVHRVLLLTGLGKIDVSLYEAIRLDGAGWWREFFTITLPACGRRSRCS